MRRERHFKELIAFDTCYSAKLPPLVILKNFKFFSEERVYFFKKPVSEHFEKSRFFSHILRQMCYNWVENVKKRNGNGKIG